MTTTVVTLDQASIDAIVRGTRGTGAANPTPTPDRSSINFGASMQNAGEAARGFGAVLGNAGGRVSDFAATMVGAITPTQFFGNVVGDLTGYIENTNVVFQNLSKVGAGFNGDLGALRAAAANARMPLDQFANLIGRNSQALAGLGAGVNQGARRFSELSRAMFEDGEVIRGMTNLGYTLEEANEFLLDNAVLLRRQAMREGMSDQQVAQATLRMAENIAFMAEITGESAEQQRQELIDAQRDGKNIAALRALEAQGLEGVQEAFNTAFTGLQVSPEAQAYMQDILQAGVPLSEMTQAFEVNNSQTAAQIRGMVATIQSNADAETKAARIRAQADAATATLANESRTATNLALARLGTISPVGAAQADVIASTENVVAGIEQMRADMARERGVSVDQISMMDAQERYFAEISDRVAAQTAGGAEGQALSRELNMATIALADAASGVNQEIARNLSANTELQTSAAAGLRALSNAAIVAGEAAQSLVSTATPGDVDQSQIDANSFRTLFEPIITTNGLQTEISNLPDVLEALGFTPEERESMIEAARAAREARDGTRASGGPVTEGLSYLVGENGPETFVPEADGTIVPNMDNELADLRRSMQSVLPGMRNTMLGVERKMIPNLQTAMQEVIPEIQAAIARLQNSTMFDTQSLIQTMMPEMRNAMLGLQENLMPEMQSLINTALPINRGNIERSRNVPTVDTREISASMSRSIEGIQDNVLPSMQEVGPQVRDAMRGFEGTMESSLQSAMQAIGPEMRNAMAGFEGTMMPSLQSTMQAIGPEMRNAMAGLEGTMMPSMQSAMQAIGPEMRNAMAGFEGTMMPSMQSAMQAIGPEMRNAMAGLEGTMMPSMQSAMQTIIPEMRNEMSGMQSSMTQLANNLRSRIEPTGTSGTNFDPNIITQELRNAMSNRSELNTQRMEQLLDTLNQGMGQLVSINNSMSRNGAKTVDALRGASGNLLQGVRAR